MPQSYDKSTTAEELVRDYASLIKGKVVLVTGVSPRSLGAFFIQSVAKAKPACIILGGRDIKKVQQTADDILALDSSVQVRNFEVDLASLASVRAAAAQVNGWDDIPVIDVLVNNAGVMALDHSVSPDGFEYHLAANHLGPFLFTNLVMKKVLASPNGRIVNVSSDGHRLNPFRFDDYNFDDGKTYNRWFAYGQSKTANMLMVLSLAEKLGSKHNLLSFSLHPGVIWTNLGGHLDWDKELDGLRSADKTLGNAEGWKEFDAKPIERGVATHIYASFDPNLKAHNGGYLLDSHVADPLKDTVKAWAVSSFEAERLWKLSEKLVGQEFSY
ncbi:Short-chain dehydrogenase TIC 32-like protein [Lachnellula arida]|uniref:Short-chain dehydrogenase TIC 32-like protein n=1 Tax=Lachnellula arida TaxID=1316785 RepID=A0A8T9BBZ6_9HELO|nr:Short-chain dehydrogenase TIC 32-like protein [Lachnellula arida]